jgi:putative Holliday junction resolvase
MLGLDPGTVRIGLAASDPSGTLASPVAVLERRSGTRLWERVREEARLRGAVGIVVGLPLRMAGGEGTAAGAARELADEAHRETALPVELWDERLSSAEAERALLAQGMPRRRRRERVDAVAAALVLQAWLDAHRGVGR